MDHQEAMKKTLNDKFLKMLDDLKNIERTLNSGMKVDFLYSSKTNFDCFEKDVSTNILILKQIIQKEIIQ
tara:strand:+ start:543 stop:752 length:210 start_codon:yes stop_codon:yes gene_type:complete